jgi:hypothetical protein
LLRLIERIVNTDDSKVLKEIITEVIMDNDVRPEDYYQNNKLLSDLLKNLKNPSNLIRIKEFYKEMRKSDAEMQKS